MQETLTEDLARLTQGLDRVRRRLAAIDGEE
jgi:hypothetical protein